MINDVTLAISFPLKARDEVQQQQVFMTKDLNLQPLNSTNFSTTGDDQWFSFISFTFPPLLAIF
jgi:hypothetical protein